MGAFRFWLLLNWCGYIFRFFLNRLIQNFNFRIFDWLFNFRFWLRIFLRRHKCRADRWRFNDLFSWFSRIWLSRLDCGIINLIFLFWNKK